MVMQIGGGGNPLAFGGGQPQTLGAGGGGFGQMPNRNDWLRGLIQQLMARRQGAQGAAPQQTGITPDGRPIITYTPPQATGMFGMPMPFSRAPQPITAEVGAMATPTGAAPNAPAIMPAGPTGPTGGAPVTMPAVAPNPVQNAPVTVPATAAAPRGPLPVGPQGPPSPWGQGGPGGWGGHQGRGQRGPMHPTQGGPIVPQQQGFAAQGTGGGQGGGGGSKSAFAPGWTDRMGGAFAPASKPAERKADPSQTQPANPADDDDEDDY